MLHLKTDLSHLPARKQREITAIRDIILDEFERYRAGGTVPWRRGAKIHKIILYGSYARGSYVDYIKSRGNYDSDYDILIIANNQKVAGDLEFWSEVEDRFPTISRYTPPVHLVAESLHFINDSLKRGRFFFVDVVREGIALYQRQRGGRLVRPGNLSPALALEEANVHYEKWTLNAAQMLRLCRVSKEDNVLHTAAFLLHQTVESLYHCLLLVLRNYTPDTHNIKHLRSLVEGIEFDLFSVWPREAKSDERLFNLLKDAYVKARYSYHYEITHEELDWLIARVEDLRLQVERICQAHIKKLEQEA